MTEPTLLQHAFDRFDEINAEDPRSEIVDGVSQPKELVYARRMSAQMERFEPDASEALRLAARAQHIARWRIPRSRYPKDRAGYKRWRTELMRFHAELAGEILADVGYRSATIDAVARLLRKEGLKRSAEVQTLEDVVCLVFLEHYFDEFANQHDDEKLVEILRRTWAKMSERGHAAALELPLGERTRRLVAEAIENRQRGVRR